MRINIEKVILNLRVLIFGMQSSLSDSPHDVDNQDIADSRKNELLKKNLFFFKKQSYEFEFYRNCCDAQSKGENHQGNVQIKYFENFITKISKTNVLLRFFEKQSLYRAYRD